MSGNHVKFGSDREPRPACDRSAPEPSLVGLRILVIEDNALVQDAMECVLTAWGCRITLADGALMASDRVQRDHAPDIILSDYRLNDGYDGINAIHLVRKIAGSQIAACLISADADENLARQAEAAGVYLLRKPVPPVKLRRMLWSLSPLKGAGV